MRNSCAWSSPLDPKAPRAGYLLNQTPLGNGRRGEKDCGEDGHERKGQGAAKDPPATGKWMRRASGRSSPTTAEAVRFRSTAWKNRCPSAGSNCAASGRSGIRAPHRRIAPSIAVGQRDPPWVEDGRRAEGLRKPCACSGPRAADKDRAGRARRCRSRVRGWR